MKTFAKQMEAQLVQTITEMLAEEAVAGSGPLMKRHVKALMKKHGINGEVSGKGADWEVEVPNETHHRKFNKHISKPHKVFGGYKTGHGSWVLGPRHKSKGDWNDKSSAHHY